MEKGQEIPGQGSLLTEHIEGNGVTDAELYKTRTVYEAEPHMPETEQPEVPSPEQETPSGLREAVAQEKRRRSQLGKHSPLERTGEYRADLKPGDFLPGFGPVTYSNWESAKQHATGLDVIRDQQRHSTPEQIATNAHGLEAARAALKPKLRVVRQNK